MTEITLTEWLQKTVGLSPVIQGKLLTSILLLVVLGLLRWLVSKIALRRIENLRVRYQWQKISGYTAFFLGFLLVGRLEWGILR